MRYGKAQLQLENKGISGNVLINLTQAGAVFGLATGAGGRYGMAGSGAILLTPAILGKLFTSPTATKLLTNSLTTKAGTQEALSLATRLSAILAREKMRGGATREF